MNRQQVKQIALRLSVGCVVCAALIALLWTQHARGANPPSGVVTLSNTEANPITYMAGPFVVANPSGLVSLMCSPQQPCDDYFLTVNIPDGYVDTQEVRVRFGWTDVHADFDIVVYKNNRIFAQAGSSSMPEYVVLPATSASYVLRIVPFNSLGDTVTTKIWVSPKPTARAPGQGTAPTFQNFVSPPTLGNASGEPSIGANWKTGKVMFEAQLQTLRVTFNDTVSPATATWVNVSPNTSITSLDPILFTDHTTGRTIVSQLSGTTSLSSYSDDDGTTWTPNEGGGMTSGVDHQTVGGGPFAPPLTGGTSVYPNAVYYCSQQLYTAFCAMSPDGGLTYGPTVPLYTTECGGIHGHVKVAPDGTVYVPNHNCGDNQGVAVSNDNGVTWAVHKVVDNDPTNDIGDSVPSDWDPSIGIATDGTVYYGYKTGGGNAHIAVSHDKGLTWANDTDVAPGLVRNSAFPAVVAGDPDRAAYAFLGTDKPGGDPAAVWYLYVAFTYDGGRSWLTVNATPNDPVQRGTICSGGLGCTGGDRNLLDFIDTTIDAEGRVLVAYADGCTGACVNSFPNSFTKKATIARQVGGDRLFSFMIDNTVSISPTP
ncbi:MAG TPA: sialidase family protein [Pyrinomonadaceae bacterium]|nr:sialidase family protein [Pyrinomonadaceae bacterium]